MEKMSDDSKNEKDSYPVTGNSTSLLSKQSFKNIVDRLLTWFDATTPRFRPLINLLGFFSAIATAALFLTPLISRDTQVANIAVTPGIEKPNIILIVVDALSAQDMSLFGYNVKTTPELEKITQNWSIYSNAQTPANCSINVYPAIVTGRYLGTFFEYGQVGYKIFTSNRWVDLFEILHQAGYQTWWSGPDSPGLYHTGAGIDNKFARPSGEVLQTTWIQMEGVSKTHFPYIPIYFFEIAHGIEKNGPDGAIFDVGQNLIAQKTMKDPFFMYMHYSGVHGVPYPSGLFLDSLLPVDAGLNDVHSQRKYYGKYDLKDQLAVDKLRLRYDEAILNQDTRLKGFIDTIKNAGYYDSSMIIITADHGQTFHNGYTSHCTPTLSYSETHVPLLVKYPHESNGQTIQTVVSTIDLAPTILDVVGINYSDDWFEGYSLLKNSPNQLTDRYVFAAKGDDLSSLTAINNRYKITIQGKKISMYDYTIDPEEKNDLVLSVGQNNEIVQGALKVARDFQQSMKNR
jgi:arylsulfatase A-like enzyme